jgi:hypothetical protein
MIRLEIADDFEQFVRIQVHRDELGAWSDAFPHSRGSIRLTLEELDEFFEKYIELVNRYKRPESQTPPEARTVLTRFFAFPAPPSEETSDGALGEEAG